VRKLEFFLKNIFKKKLHLQGELIRPLSNSAEKSNTRQGKKCISRVLHLDLPGYQLRGFVEGFRRMELSSTDELHELGVEVWVSLVADDLPSVFFL